MNNTREFKLARPNASRTERRGSKTACARFSLAALIVLASCSGGDKIVSPDGQANNNGTSGKLTTEDSTFVVGFMAGAAFSSIKALRTITNNSLPTFGTAAIPCTPATVGGADANGNGIPDDRTQTYTTANCSISQNGIPTTVTGTVRIQDLNGIYGYRVTYSNLVVRGAKLDTTLAVTIDGVYEYAYVNATQARSLENNSLTIVQSTNQGSLTLVRSANVACTFTPSGSNTIALNRALPTGSMSCSGPLTLTLSATGNLVTPGGPTSQTISLNLSTPTALTASITCTSDAAFDAGQLRSGVGGSQTGTVVANFVGCGSGQTTTGGPKPPGGTKK